MSEDVERMEIFLAHNIPDFVGAFVYTVLTATVLFVVDWRLALATIVVIPAGIVFQILPMGRAREVVSKWFSAVENMNATMIEYIQGMPIIKAFNHTVESFSKYSKSIEECISLEDKMCGRWYLSMSIFSVSITANMLLLLPVGATMYLSDVITLQKFVLFLLLGVGFGNPMLTMIQFGRLMEGNFEGQARIEAVLTAKSLSEPDEPGIPGRGVFGKKVEFGYDRETRVLKGIDFSIPAGRFVALVRPSGAGKSTLARLIPRFWDVDTGSISLGETDIRKVKIDDVMDQFGLVFQNVHLFNDTVLANLRIGRPGIPAAAPFYLWQKNVLARGLRKRSDSLAEVNSEVIEYVQGIEVLKAFKQTGKQSKKINEILKKFRDLNIHVTMKAELPMTFTQVVIDLGFCLILLFAAFFLLSGTTTLTVFLIFLIMGLRIYEPIKLLLPSSAFLNMAEPAIHKIKDILDTKPLPQPENGQVPKAFDIKFKDVTFSYDKTPVLKNVSFTIPEKRITALVGPSGSGKTTITRLIARFWDVDSGEVRVGGHDIRDMKIDDLLSQVSMVFQDVYLFNDTIYQNIAYGSKTATRDKIIDAAKTARCHDFISNLPHGYDTMVGEGGATLSGCEKQRISIARAILKDEAIILLDEATASVDPENEYLIQGAINSLVESKTLIIIAHRLSTITSADQIIVLNSEGKVEEMGKHTELLKAGRLYRRLWESRQQARSWKVSHFRNE
jgi:ATP-binding cassette subfamily B protein